MKLEDLEEYIVEQAGELIDKCTGVCKESVPPALRISEGIVYEGCDRCLIATAVDEVGLDTFSVTFRDGRFGEFIRLENAVIEITDDSAQVFSVSDFLEYLSDLMDFGLIGRNEFSDISAWVTRTKG
ncbi:MAG: hypothetical protein J7L55_03370 [Desulfurococcales archaeon]|nr:hypothetical protein [Desulfurococcales archaeon]